MPDLNQASNGVVPVPGPLLSASPGSMGGKEAEMPRPNEPGMEEVKEFEVPKEVASHVVKVAEHIEIPPDLKNIGVMQPHSHGSVSDALQKQLTLPLSDDQIGTGLTAPADSSFLWLANWCLKQLKMKFFNLKQVGIHFIRVKKAG